MSAKRYRTRSGYVADEAYAEALREVRVGAVPEEVNLSCNTAEAESVTAIVADHPKRILPGERSLVPEVLAVNPGRALEVAG
jgi:hypothetical protein